MVLAAAEDLSDPFEWPDAGVTRVPYRLFSDPEIYALEQQRIFRGPVWNYLCLEIDIPNPGDHKTTTVGEIPVVVTRDENGDVHAMVNRCAHKGALVCLKERGNSKTMTCVYHSWSYDLRGRLKGIAFRDGLNGKGGMPEDFDRDKHRLEPLRIEIICGLVFGTFSDETPSIESYLGEKMTASIRRNLGRPLKPLGMHSQIIHNNWKLYAENVRDSYHATLLHTFYTTFKINRLDMDGGIVMADDKWHHISFAKRKTLQESEEYQNANVHSAQYESKLDGPELLNTWDEYDDGITHSIQGIFPNLAIHSTLNSLAVRFFAPRGVDETELFWIYLGCEDDTEEQTNMRVMQGNLTGTAGLVSLEDGCINEFVQRGTRGSGDREAFIEMGGRDVEPSEASRATEVAIRGFWTGYRRIMGFA
ncbi:MAG: Rieske 2Fe-2S domain-containing protein [Rhodospirillaceae bacterium]|nr:Rieske 2Fe-2S domain-containing protein [Rhodospirillaceae bacterium]MBT6140083.1 Rieske 2Fe-2S domain-containing protein [Rhodospirillaceae bacterium]